MQDYPPIKIFIVYAREDAEALRELRVQFIPVARSERLEVWYDGEILPGQHWDQEIKAHLQSADIILLFISKYFFASEYIQENELKAALARHEAGKSVVVPVIVRPCVWQDAFEVSQFQVLPTGARAIFSSAWRDQDEAMVSVVEGVKEVARNVRRKRPKIEEAERKAQKQEGKVAVEERRQERKPFPVQMFAYVGGGLVGLVLIWFLVRGCVEKASDDVEPSKQPEIAVPKNETTSASTPKPVPPPASFTFAYSMMRVEGGTFTMGDNQSRFTEDKPAHQVTVGAFWIGQYEVTQAVWIKIMETNPAQHKCDQCPVERVSWHEVQEFIRRLNEKTGMKYRLPTEAEWEFAARAGKSKGNKYAGGSDLDMVAWYDGNSDGMTHPVGQKNRNAFLLYDMSGNVCEWCQDNWHPNYDDAPIDGSAWVQEADPTRVFRGGCWHRNYWYCDVNARYWDYSRSKFDNLGFRLAITSLQ